MQLRHAMFLFQINLRAVVGITGSQAPLDFYILIRLQ